VARPAGCGELSKFNTLVILTPVFARFSKEILEAKRFVPVRLGEALDDSFASVRQMCFDLAAIGKPWSEIPSNAVRRRTGCAAVWSFSPALIWSALFSSTLGA
jgi:hypothetical protein